MKAYELLDEENKLCRRNYSTSKEEPTNFTSPKPFPGTTDCKAVRWDMIGAMMYCYPDYNEYYKHYNTIMTCPRINEWVKAYKEKLTEPELNKINKMYGVNWVIFNDAAKYEEIVGLLKELDI